MYSERQGCCQLALINGSECMTSTTSSVMTVSKRQPSVLLAGQNHHHSGLIVILVTKYGIHSKTKLYPSTGRERKQYTWDLLVKPIKTKTKTTVYCKVPSKITSFRKLRHWFRCFILYSSL